MKKFIAALMCAVLVLSISGVAVSAEETKESLGDTSVESVSAEIDGTVYEGTLSTGAGYFAYIPATVDYGNRATSNPLLIVYGDTAFTVETAKETVLGSGLAEIADHENGPVILVNPAGESWSEADKDSYLAIRKMFSDGTGSGYDLYNQPENEGRSASSEDEEGNPVLGSYPGTCTRMYVFAEGSGADFAYEYLAQGIFGEAQYVGSAVWKPVGMFLLNAGSDKEVDLKGVAAEEYAHTDNDAARQVPVVIVNGSETVVNAFAALDDEDKMITLESESASLKEARNELLSAYDTLLEHYMTRDMGEGVTLMPLRSAAQQGLVETKGTYVSESGKTIVYYQYLPEEYETMEEGTLPLFFGFHGGGNDAEMFVWSSGWAEVAADQDLAIVSVDQHSVLQSEDDPDLFLEFLAKLEADYPVIDHSRIYVGGFSMGSMMSTYLGGAFDNVIAAMVPTNGFAYQIPSHGCVVPTYYNAGENSHFNLPFMMEGAMAEVPTTGTNVRNGMLELFVANGVMTQEEADGYEWPELTEDFLPSFAEGDVKYGIEADEVVVNEDTSYYGVTETVRYYNSADSNCYTVLSSATYAGHEPLWGVSRSAWDFISRFSRNEDGSISIAE